MKDYHVIKSTITVLTATTWILFLMIIVHLGPIQSNELGECLTQWKFNSLNVVTQMATSHIYEYGIPTVPRAKSDFLGGIFRILAFKWIISNALNTLLTQRQEFPTVIQCD